MICEEISCAGAVVARGKCRKHYVRWYRRRPDGPRCTADGCISPAYSNGYCAKHYGRVKRHGDPAVTSRVRGRMRKLDGNGYVLIRRPDHPAAIRGWVSEHRVIMEEILGRSLIAGENVHHVNGVRADNRGENLELWVISQPAGQRPEDLVAWAREILRRYAGEA